MDKFVFDTNVVRGFKLNTFTKGEYVSSVIVTEIISSANDSGEAKAYLQGWEIADRAGQLLTPTFADWQMTAKIMFWLAHDRKKEGWRKIAPPCAAG
jgi:hypothetical protein